MLINLFFCIFLYFVGSGASWALNRVMNKTLTNGTNIGIAIVSAYILYRIFITNRIIYFNPDDYRELAAVLYFQTALPGVLVIIAVIVVTMSNKRRSTKQG